ncbi:MFS transporter [Sinomonas cellulolyticus]|jgi:MFS family permease|nr:MFS transporter [Sinomonas sp. KCTC 49339]GHG55414.1 MFS transporter [Sinomonas sp. KCTC 49339]
MASSKPTAARTAAVSGFLGSTLEYYDFFIFGSAAALFFGRLFFPDAGAASSLLSFATLGVAYIARPLGAILWGHFGDRLGRKNVLVLTLVLMGASTFLIGCLPTYSAVGAIAPIALVALRLVQGISAGGESPGSSSLTLEHSPEGRRAFFTSFTMSGIQFGIVISSVVFIPVTMLPQDALMSWGWRVPFLLSAVVTLVAFYLRRRLEEPEVFTEIKEDAKAAAIPLVELFRNDLPNVVRVTLAALVTMVNTVFTVFALAYATEVVKLDKAMMLIVIAVANLVTVFTQPLWALLSDRIGRKPVFIAGTVGSAVLVFAFFTVLGTGNWPLIFITAITLTGVAYAMPNGVYPAYFPELFPARTRYTGMAVSLMLGLLVAGFTPAIGAALTAGNHANWTPVAWMTVGFCAIAAIAALTARETFRIPKAELGLKPSPRTVAGTAKESAVQEPAA